MKNLIFGILILFTIIMLIIGYCAKKGVDKRKKQQQIELTHKDSTNCKL